MQKARQAISGRIHELDLLRGFFILVIIVDHVQRWPSPLTYITGEGRLWVSAAEGFFIISGLLIGYLRGYKALKKPFREIASLLLRRAVLLYIWAVIITFIAVALVMTFNGDTSLIPRMPEVTGLAYIWQVFTQQYVFDWIYFLRLYCIMLLFAPLAILLFRKRLWWLVPIISAAIYGLSFLMETPEAATQWQALFFIPAAIGFHLDTIVGFFKSHIVVKRLLIGTLLLSTAVTMVLSYFWVHGWNYVEADGARVSRDSYVAARGWIDPYFTKDPLSVGRVVLAFVWFGGLLALFNIIRPLLMKSVAWLLLPFGYFSLTAYCLQAIALLGVQFIIPASIDPWVNVFIGLGSVMIIWGLLKVKLVRKVLPQ